MAGPRGTAHSRLTPRRCRTRLVRMGCGTTGTQPQRSCGSSAATAIRPRHGGLHGPTASSGLLPPEPAEHLHRQADRGNARRGVPPSGRVHTTARLKQPARSGRSMTSVTSSQKGSPTREYGHLNLIVDHGLFLICGSRSLFPADPSSRHQSSADVCRRAAGSAVRVDTWSPVISAQVWLPEWLHSGSGHSQLGICP
jgi:hypothetical protein